METFLLIALSAVGILQIVLGFWHTRHLLGRHAVGGGAAIGCITTYFVSADYSIWCGILHVILYIGLCYAGIRLLRPLDRQQQ